MKVRDWGPVAGLEIAVFGSGPHSLSKSHM